MGRVLATRFEALVLFAAVVFTSVMIATDNGNQNVSVSQSTTGAAVWDDAAKVIANIANSIGSVFGSDQHSK